MGRNLCKWCFPISDIQEWCVKILLNHIFPFVLFHPFSAYFLSSCPPLLNIQTFSLFIDPHSLQYVPSLLKSFYKLFYFRWFSAPGIPIYNFSLIFCKIVPLHLKLSFLIHSNTWDTASDYLSNKLVNWSWFPSLVKSNI